MFPETPDDYYRPIYFEALDLITTSITDRFQRGQRELLSEVCQLFQLLLVIPATNAVSERSFSAL